MKYGNIIPEEMVYRPINYLTQEIDKAFEKEFDSPRDLRNFVYNAVQCLYNEDSNSRTISKTLKGTLMSIKVMTFKYNGREYYWWDLFSDDQKWLCAGLEFYPFVDDEISFVLFATRNGQPPFVWRENIHY